MLSQSGTFIGVRIDGSTYKTNFWDGGGQGSYDPFYPGGLGITPLATGGFPTTTDIGLPVPNVENLYIGPDGMVNSRRQPDEFLSAVQHAMPGLSNTYVVNIPQLVEEYYADKPFFVNFPFGYVADNVNWFEAAGVPFAAFDDFGRAERLSAGAGAGHERQHRRWRRWTRCCRSPARRAARTATGPPGRAELAQRRHRDQQPDNGRSAGGEQHQRPRHQHAGHRQRRVRRRHQHPAPARPQARGQVREHRLRQRPGRRNCLTTAADPCTINAATPNGTASCLTNKALVQNKPVVCQVCHYTPALDLAQVGPKAGAPGTEANGRNQIAHQSNSRVMHNHHGSSSSNGFPGLFPAIPAPTQDANGVITNQSARTDGPGEQLLPVPSGHEHQVPARAPCSTAACCARDCHGSMIQVGNDFSKNVSPDQPGGLHPGRATSIPTPARHRACPGPTSRAAGPATPAMRAPTWPAAPAIIKNVKDIYGNTDNIRLLQAFKTGDAKATPIVPDQQALRRAGGARELRDLRQPRRRQSPALPGEHGPRRGDVRGLPRRDPCGVAERQPDANDNVAATQLQGHTGVIVECSTCHGNELDTSSTLAGPHGLHTVGGNAPFANRSVHGSSTIWGSGGYNDATYLSKCQACHGGTSRSTSTGTVLSRAFAQRTLRGQTVAQGTPIACTRCH